MHGAGPFLCSGRMLSIMPRRTSVILDDDLVERAKAALGTSGISDTIEAALREAVRTDQRRRLASVSGPAMAIDSDGMLEARATWGDDVLLADTSLWHRPAPARSPSAGRPP